MPKGTAFAQTIKKLLARERPKTLPPGGSCHWAAPKSRPMTEEECGRKFWSREMLELAGCFINIQPYFGSISCTNFQITARIPTLAKSRLRRLLAARACGRSLPTRFFRTSFGRATLPPGEGISLHRDFFDKLKSGRSHHDCGLIFCCGGRRKEKITQKSFRTRGSSAQWL